MTVKGTLHAKGETQKISDKFSKREFAIKTEEKYPQFIPCQLINDKCPNLDFWDIGDHIEAEINLRGREWKAPDGNVKYFATLEAWKISGMKTEANSNKRDGITQNFVEDKLQSEYNDIAESDDDLPF